VRPSPRKKGKRKGRFFQSKQRFPERKRKDWEGPTVDYKEIDLLRKFLTNSNKLMSRKRAGTSAEEQRSLKRAVKYARFLALVPYSGT
jgi:small subunit ribosomal protein S18